jgi:hypothetical protein
MKVLFLPYNQLENIDGLEKCVEIEFLSLAGNKLKNIDGLMKVKMIQKI